MKINDPFLREQAEMVVSIIEYMDKLLKEHETVSWDMLIYEDEDCNYFDIEIDGNEVQHEVFKEHGYIKIRDLSEPSNKTDNTLETKYHDLDELIDDLMKDLDKITLN